MNRKDEAEPPAWIQDSELRAQGCGLRGLGSGVCTKYTRHLLQWQWYAPRTKHRHKPGRDECLASKYEEQDQSLELEQEIKVEGLGLGLGLGMGLSRQTNVGGCNWSGVTGARTQSNNDVQLPHKLAALSATPAEPI